MRTETIQRCVLSISFVALCAETAWAQAGDEGGGIQTRDYASEQQEPEPPGKGELQDDASKATFSEVAIDAGTGSPLSYASATVVELGGSFALTIQSDTTTFRITPVLGYFFMDNIELSLLPGLTIVDVDGNTDTNIGLLVEPSYHLPVTDRVFVFVGLGVGFTYADTPGADFALRPRLGSDILVGRSGIFKPAFFLDFGADDGVTRGGLEASFTVML